MENFIDKMKRLLALFKAVHNRKPKDSDEFQKWCDYVEHNSTTISKPDLIKSSI